MNNSKTEKRFLKLLIAFILIINTIKPQIYLYRQSDYLMIMGFKNDNFINQKFQEINLITPEKEKASFSIENSQFVKFNIPALTKLKIDFEGNCIMPILFSYKKTKNDLSPLTIDATQEKNLKTKLKIKLILFGNFFFDYLSFKSKIYYKFDTLENIKKTRLKFQTQKFASYFQEVNGYIFCAQYDKSKKRTFKVNVSWKSNIPLKNSQPLLSTKEGKEIDINMQVGSVDIDYKDTYYIEDGEVDINLMNSFDQTDLVIRDQEGNVLEYEIYEKTNKVFEKLEGSDQDIASTFFEDDPFFYDETEVEPKYEVLPEIKPEYDPHSQSNINLTKDKPDDFEDENFDPDDPDRPGGDDKDKDRDRDKDRDENFDLENDHNGPEGNDKDGDFNKGENFNNHDEEGFDKDRDFNKDENFNSHDEDGFGNDGKNDSFPDDFGDDSFPDDFGDDSFPNDFGDDSFPNDSGDDSFPNDFGDDVSTTGGNNDEDPNWDIENNQPINDSILDTNEDFNDTNNEDPFDDDPFAISKSGVETDNPIEKFEGSEFIKSFTPLDGKYYSIKVKIKDNNVKHSSFTFESKSKSFDILDLITNLFIGFSVAFGIGFVFLMIFVFYINFLNKKSLIAYKKKKQKKNGIKNYNPYFLVEDKINSINLALEHKRASKFGKLPDYNEEKDFCKCCKSQKYQRKFIYNDKIKDIAKSSPIISFYFLFLIFSITILCLNFIILCVYELAQGINLQYCFLNCKLNLPLNDLNQYDKVNLNLFIKQNRDLRDAFKNSIFFVLTILNFCILYIGKYLFFFYIRNYYEKIDDEIITPSDYAIKIKKIKKEKTLDLMKKKLEDYFFELLDDKVKIEKIIYIYDIREYQDIIDKIKNINISKKKNKSLKNLKEELEQKLKKLKEKKIDLKNKIISDDSKFIGEAFVIFENEDQLKKVVKYCYNKNRFFFKKKDKKYLVDRAREPKDIIWENFGLTQKEKIFRKILTVILSFGFIALFFYLLNLYQFKIFTNDFVIRKQEFIRKRVLAGALNRKENYSLKFLSSAQIFNIQLENQVFTYVLIFANFILNIVLTFLIDFENQSSNTLKKIKTLFFLIITNFVSTAALIFVVIIRYLKNSGIYENYLFIIIISDEIYKLIVSNLVIDLIFMILDPGHIMSILKKFFIKQKLNNLNKNIILQNDVNEVHEGIEFDVVDGFIKIFGILTTSLFYQVALPYSLPIAIINLIVFGIIDRYKIINYSKRPIKLGKDFYFVIINLFSFPIFLLSFGFLIFQNYLVGTIYESSYAMVFISGLEWFFMDVRYIDNYLTKKNNKIYNKKNIINLKDKISDKKKKNSVYEKEIINLKNKENEKIKTYKIEHLNFSDDYDKLNPMYKLELHEKLLGGKFKSFEFENNNEDFESNLNDNHEDHKEMIKIEINNKKNLEIKNNKKLKKKKKN